MPPHDQTGFHQTVGFMNSVVWCFTAAVQYQGVQCHLHWCSCCAPWLWVGFFSTTTASIERQTLMCFMKFSTEWWLLTDEGTGCVDMCRSHQFHSASKLFLICPGKKRQFSISQGQWHIRSVMVTLVHVSLHGQVGNILAKAWPWWPASSVYWVCRVIWTKYF